MMEIFILAGQSNMAGRGSMDHLPFKYSHSDEKVLCFTASDEAWEPAREPLHRDVDLRKRERCGVGPALVCGRALIALRTAARVASKDRVIGLVPCAIGGASLDEWQEDYRGIVDDCEDKGTSSSHQGVKSPWEYKPGAKNLFGAMAERATQALASAPEGSHLAGVLWYQGETDASDESSAASYLDRFKLFVSATRRRLGILGLRFFTVAITGTTNRLLYLRQVREVQLSVGPAVGLGNIWVVDSFGLPMLPDGLHLTTRGQVELGERLARLVFTCDVDGDSMLRETHGLVGCEHWGWVWEEQRAEKARAWLEEMTTMSRLQQESKHTAISQVTKDLEGLINQLTGRETDPTHEEENPPPLPERLLLAAPLGPANSPAEEIATISEPSLPRPPGVGFVGTSSDASKQQQNLTKQEMDFGEHVLSKNSDGKKSQIPFTTTGIPTPPRQSQPLLGVSGSRSVEGGWETPDVFKGGNTGNSLPVGDLENLQADSIAGGANIGKLGLQCDRPLKQHHLQERGFLKSVSSEVEVLSFARLLYFLSPTPEDQLLILGCGGGRSVLVSALLYPLRGVQGMDLVQGCFDEARALLSVYTKEGQSPTSFGDEKEEGEILLEVTDASKVDLVEGDFFEQDWGEATLVIVSSSCFDDSLMLQVSQRCQGLPSNARVVTLDKPLPCPQSYTDRGGGDTDVMAGWRKGERRAVAGEFQVSWQCQVQGSWRGAAVAYVHQRSAPRG
ncbi:unnamed protein product [Discosporangium mesarthrocarpum]